MKKRALVLTVTVLALLVVATVVFFLSPSQRSSINIQVGIPVSFDDTGEVSAIYFDGFLKNQKETDIILLAMINARPLSADSAPASPPDGIITVRYEATGYPYYVRFGEDSVIYGNGSECKEIWNDHTNVVGLLKNITDSLKNNQKYT